jgi:hypothetical protein
MLSDFIINHPKMNCFVLSDEEWKEALRERPDLLNEDDYLPNSATSKDNNFDNESILKQFERIIFLMRFSRIFKDANYRVDILVDNATTHTKASIDVSMFIFNICRFYFQTFLKLFIFS